MPLDLSLVYANENEVNAHLSNTYGYGHGQAEWINADAYDTVVEADLASFNNTDTVLTFTGLSEANSLELGQILKLHKANHEELVIVTDFEYSNAGKTAGTVTVIRSTVAIQGHGGDPHFHIVTSEDRVLACQIATQLINSYHAQETYSDALFLADDMKPIAILTALYVNRIYSMSRISEKIKAVSSGSYSDRVLSISSAADLSLPNNIKQLIDRLMVQWGYSIGYKRA